MTRSLKVNKVSIVDQICTTMKEAIRDGVWEENEKIPSETELAEIYGVSRLSVRAALQKLSALGIIETRVGEGSFVRSFSLKPIIREISLFYEGDDQYRETQQLRVLLESECMRIAATEAPLEEREKLRELVADYHRAIKIFHNDVDNEEYLKNAVKADFAFHYHIICMSHNHIFMDVYYMAERLVRSHISALLKERTLERRKQNLPALETDMHDLICEGIISGDISLIKQGEKELWGDI